METKGRLHSISRGFENNKLLVTFELDFLSPEGVSEITGKDLRIKIKKWVKRRSLNANRYFHVLNDEIAAAIGSSRFYTKNWLIAKYGERLIIDDVPQTITTKAPPEYMLEQEMLHTSLFNTSEKNGATWYSYRLYMGSHLYDSAQMSKLIDGAVYEAKQVGVETMSPEEIERLKKEWQSQ